MATEASSSDASRIGEADGLRDGWFVVLWCSTAGTVRRRIGDGVDGLLSLPEAPVVLGVDVVIGCPARQARVRKVHPELAFYGMNGDASVTGGTHSQEGRAIRAGPLGKGALPLSPSGRDPSWVRAEGEKGGVQPGRAERRETVRVCNGPITFDPDGRGREHSRNEGQTPGVADVSSCFVS